MAVGYPIQTLFNKLATITPYIFGSDTIGGTTKVAGTSFTAKCHIRALTGDEKDMLGRVGVKSTHRIYLLTNITILEHYEITVDTDVFNVSYVDNKHRLNHHLEVDVILRE